MNATFLTENLNKKLSFALKAISPRSQLPILSCFLLRLKENSMEILATDLEIGIQTKVNGNILKEGEITVPARPLVDLVSNLPTGEVEFNLIGNNLEIKTSKTKSVIQTQPHDDFPSLFEEKGESILNINLNLFKDKLSRVLFSTASETARPILEGVLFEKKEDFIDLVSTDGYRLSFEKIEQAGSKDGLKIVVPTKLLREINSLEATDIEIFLSNSNNQLLFSSGDDIIVGRIIEGEFPAYEKIIPKESTSRITFSKADFQKAVKNASVFARETSSAIKLELLKNSIKISSKTASLGETNFEIEAVLTGEENEIAFNPRFLSEFLANISTDELIFEMTGPLNAGMFKIKDDPQFIHIIMPIRM